MNSLKTYGRAALTVALLLTAGGCAVMYDSGYQTRYFQRNLVVKQAEQTADNRLRIDYQTLNETVWSSPGVDYAVRDEALYITPVRCYQRHECSPQAKNSSAQRDQVSVTVPYNGGLVYLVFEDGEKPLPLVTK